MAGRGARPKPADQRARRNKPDAASITLEFRPGRQPQLPKRMPIGLPWPMRTRTWWRMWAKSAIAETFTDTDWSELLDTAVLHGLYWHGDIKVASELRLRVAKFGATPEDRARLKIEFGEAQAPAEPAAGQAARERYGKLRVVPDAKAG